MASSYSRNINTDRGGMHQESSNLDFCVAYREHGPGARVSNCELVHESAICDFLPQWAPRQMSVFTKEMALCLFRDCCNKLFLRATLCSWRQHVY